MLQIIISSDLEQNHATVLYHAITERKNVALARISSLLNSHFPFRPKLFGISTSSQKPHTAPKHSTQAQFVWEAVTVVDWR